jgi:hypothetical protein
MEDQMTDFLQRLSGAALALFFLISYGESIQAQETKLRELRPFFDVSQSEMPVEIVSIRLNGQEIKPGERVLGNDDWLKGVSFNFKNVSDKPIAYLSVGFRFPIPQGFVVSVLSHGVDTSPGEPRRGSSPLPIMPGESLNLVLTEEKYKSFLYVLAQGGLSRSFEVAPYFIYRVCFENEPDVIWEGGYLKRRDPGEIGRFNIIEKYVLPAKQR